jgi:hypothetical protein
MVAVGLVVMIASPIVVQQDNVIARKVALDMCVKSLGLACTSPTSRSATPGIFFGLGLFGIGVVALAVRTPSKTQVDEERVQCTYCAEDIKPEALICPHCRSDLRRDSAADRLLSPRS